MAENAEARHVTLYPSQWKAVEQRAAEVGSPGNISAGLRALVADYQKMKAKDNGKEGE